MRLAVSAKLGSVGGTKDLSAQKQQSTVELLRDASALKRGQKATNEDKERMAKAIRELEMKNPTPAPIKSPLLNGKWELAYTTSEYSLGYGRPEITRPTGPIYQTIDLSSMRAKNEETWPAFNSVTANLTVETDSRVMVQMDTYKFLSVFPIKRGPNAKGPLEITYLDEDMRISRNRADKVFVLTMADRNAKL